ncbi:aminopeptidase [Candidatus Gracilibacteria bacterium]|nr:aminopeptidase [Candidatus Gracilibacteria bacterium]
MYKPSYELLKKYADVLVKFALRSGEGTKKNDVIFVQIPECAKSFYLPLQESILESGAHPIFEYIPDGVARHFFENADDHQLLFYPSYYLHGKVKQMTHVISIIADADMHHLKGIDPKKISNRMISRKPYIERRVKKENDGKMTWTAALYGTSAMAKEAGISLEEYRKQIINACFLDKKDPIKKRKGIMTEINSLKNKLDKLKIEYLHIKGEDVDLKIKIGKNRQRLGGGGRNIPSFEIFTSPDWRGTEGWIKLNQPLYRYGQMIKGIKLKFDKGIVVHFEADQNGEVFEQMLKIPNMNKLGEFSLTDSRFSRITKFMAETLYDENVGGKYGNTHIALGKSFDECYVGDIKKLNKNIKNKIGLNESAEHVDIISTTNRTVTATLADGKKKVIYKDGKFTL